MGDARQNVLWVDVDVVPRHLLHQRQHFGQSSHGLSAHARHGVVAEVQQVGRDAVQQDVDAEPRSQVQDELQRRQLGVAGVQRLQAGSDDGHQDDEALLLPGAQHAVAAVRRRRGGRGAWRRNRLLF